MHQAEIFAMLLENISSPTLCPDDYANLHATDYRVEPLGDGGLWIYAKFADGSEIDTLIEE